MFTIHSKVELHKQGRRPIGSYARHYYNLYQLAATPEIEAMLNSAEYAQIKADYDQIRRTYFSKEYIAPAHLSFANSDALYPPPELANIIGKEYTQQCKVLCYGPYPTWEAV